MDACRAKKSLLKLKKHAKRAMAISSATALY
jgi:hypothetical protein